MATRDRGLDSRFSICPLPRMALQESLGCFGEQLKSSGPRDKGCQASSFPWRAKEPSLPRLQAPGVQVGPAHPHPNSLGAQVSGTARKPGTEQADPSGVRKLTRRVRSSCVALNWRVRFKASLTAQKNSSLHLHEGCVLGEDIPSIF